MTHNSFRKASFISTFLVSVGWNYCLKSVRKIYSTKAYCHDYCETSFSILISYWSYDAELASWHINCQIVWEIEYGVHSCDTGIKRHYSKRSNLFQNCTALRQLIVNCVCVFLTEPLQQLFPLYDTHFFLCMASLWH